MRTPWRYVSDKVLQRSLKDPQHWLLSAIKASANSNAGARVTADTATRVAAVFASIKVLSETIASLPLALFRREGENKTPARDHRLFRLFLEPNGYMTGYELRENLVTDINYHGNSYHQKIERAGYIRQLIPLHPENMTIQKVNGTVSYTYKDPVSAESTKFRGNKIWQCKNLSISHTANSNAPEGVIGISPIATGREVIGTAMAADEYAARFFSNNASAGLHVSHPQKLSEAGLEYLKQVIAEYGKLENKFKSIITQEDVKIEDLAKTNEESQFLETRQFSVEEIARLFRVPSVLIGHPDKAMTYASAEQMFLSFVMHTIRPWCVRLEQSMNRFLIPDADREEYFFEHNLAGLLRGDMKTQAEAFAKGRQWGWLNVDEIRSLLNMNALPDEQGQVYLEPKNMGEPGDASTKTEQG